MELTHLRYFASVAETKSFARGAKLAHVSPPAMSKAIKNLEAEVGAALFERTTRHVALTDAGRILLARARRVFDEVDGIRRDLDEASSIVAGEVRVAANEVFSIYLLPSAIAALVRAHPAVAPRTFEMLPDAIERELAEGRIDVGFSIGGSAGRDIETTTLGRSGGVVVCGRGHPLYRSRRLRAADAARYPFVVPRFFQREHLPSLDQFPDDRFVRATGATMELLQLGIQLAIAGAYLGYFPEISVRQHLESGALRTVRGVPPGPPFELRAWTRRGGRPRAAVRALRDEMARIVAEGRPADRG
jgi:DNA-binding transcriptional LysR family regulator